MPPWLVPAIVCAFAAPHQSPASRVPKTGVSDRTLRIPVDRLPREAVFHIPGAPDWMVVTNNGVWVANEPKGTVSLLDPRANAVARTVRVGLKPCSGLAFGGRSLWVPLCGSKAIARVDPSNGRVAVTIRSGVADSEGGIGFGDGSVWILTDSTSTLARIDPETNRMTARIAVAAGSVAATYGEGSVWTTSVERSVVTRVDPRTNSVVATIPVGPAPRFLTVGEGAIWTLNQGDGSVSRIDPSVNRVVASIPVGVPGPGGEIAAGAGSVWVTSMDFPLTRIDATTNRVAQQFVGAGGDSVRVGFGSVWLTDLRGGAVWRLDPAKIARTRAIE